MKYPELSNKTKEYWTEEDFVKLKNAKSIADVYDVARIILARMPEKLSQVCGPISNGGFGSIEKNLDYLSQQIKSLQERDVAMFDQMPLEETFHRIVNNKDLNQKYDNILNDFYEPLFSSGKIETLYFVKDWESSKGATWEHNKGNSLGLSIVYL